MSSIIGFFVGIIHSITSIFVPAPTAQVPTSDIFTETHERPAQQVKTQGAQVSSNQNAAVQTNTTNTFTVTPTAGTAPLAVIVSWSDVHAAGYIDFGDSTQLNCAEKQCAAGETSHAYTKPGTYVVRLYRYASRASEMDTVVGSASVVVSAQSEHGSLLAAPLAGSSASWQFNVTGSFAMQQDSYLIDFGDGVTENLTCITAFASSEPLCKQFKEVTHTYTKTGQYQVRVYANSRGLGSNTIYELLSAKVSAEVSAGAQVQSSGPTIDMMIVSGAPLTGSIGSGPASFHVLVGRGGVTPPSKYPADLRDMPEYVLGGSVALGGVQVANGRWSMITLDRENKSMLTPGTYTVAIYEYVPTGGGKLLATSRITVR